MAASGLRAAEQESSAAVRASSPELVLGSGGSTHPQPRTVQLKRVHLEPFRSISRSPAII
eukprot:2926564-Prymnesium_polylepis.1